MIHFCNRLCAKAEQSWPSDVTPSSSGSETSVDSPTQKYRACVCSIQCLMGLEWVCTPTKRISLTSLGWGRCFNGVFTVDWIRANRSKKETVSILKGEIYKGKLNFGLANRYKRYLIENHSQKYCFSQKY